MTYDVDLEPVAARQLAAARDQLASAVQLSTAIRRLLDDVWATLRAQNIRTGHNVVVYFGSPRNIAAGVEILDQFQPTDTVQPLSTPTGDAAHVVYWGDYSQMAPAYAPLDQWFASQQRKRAGISWEVYGDRDADPSRLRTDISFLLDSA